MNALVICVQTHRRVVVDQCFFVGVHLVCMVGAYFGTYFSQRVQQYTCPPMNAPVEWYLFNIGRVKAIFVDEGDEFERVIFLFQIVYDG